MSQESAIITGVTGQDGSYLAELLIREGYFVYGGIRRNSDFTTKRIDHLFNHSKFTSFNFDSCDSNSVCDILSRAKPKFFFNLAALSHVGTSFDIPNYVAQADGLSVVALIALIQRIAPDCVFYQASTSELFGGAPGQEPQDINTRFDPRSPYAVAKQMGFYSALNARRTGSLCTVNGILFNHESPRRGRTFVTKKITLHVANLIKNKTNSSLKLGNLDARRDWGYAPDYVEVMYESVLAPDRDVYICGTGKSITVREFCRMAFESQGLDLIFEGSGIEEKGYERATGRVLVEVSSKYFRPLDVEVLTAGKHGNLLLKRDYYGLEKIVSLMTDYDLKYDDYGGHEHGDRYSRFWR